MRMTTAMHVVNIRHALLLLLTTIDVSGRIIGVNVELTVTYRSRKAVETFLNIGSARYSNTVLSPKRTDVFT